MAAQSGAQAATAGTDSLFGNATATAYDGGSSTSYEIGTVFTPRVNGTVTQLRFYRVNPCDYGAVWGTLYQSNPFATTKSTKTVLGTTNTDISLRNLTLTNTRASASRNVGIINNGGVNQRITMSGFTITGGPSTAFYSNTATSAYNKTAWTVNGVTLLDQLGWA